MKYKDLWDELTRTMGYWVDLEHPYITFDNKYIETVWHLLSKLHEKRPALQRLYHPALFTCRRNRPEHARTQSAWLLSWCKRHFGYGTIWNYCQRKNGIFKCWFQCATILFSLDNHTLDLAFKYGFGCRAWNWISAYPHFLILIQVLKFNSLLPKNW